MDIIFPKCISYRPAQLGLVAPTEIHDPSHLFHVACGMYKVKGIEILMNEENILLHGLREHESPLLLVHDHETRKTTF